MDTISLTGSRASAWSGWSILGLTRAQARVAAMALALTLAFAFRITALSTYGFSQDEIHKVEAIEEYRAGHFVANAEHPMLMKLAMWGSVELAGAWNRIASPDRAIALETAVRLPNAVAGTATTFALYGVADLLFGPSVAVVASVIWALDVNAIATNRIGKEDTLLLLFFLLAVWCYERAKRQGDTDPQGAQRWYAGSGAMFGLMLASKYMPVSLMAYAVFNAVTDRAPGANRPRWFWMSGAALLAFLAANPVILMPSTWRYVAIYMDGGMLAHHGSLFAGRMYITNIPISPLGLPVTFYLQYLATKVPLVVLGAAAVGLVELVRRREERGFVLLRVLLVIQLVLYSLLAAKFLRYMLPVHAVVDLIAAIGLVAVIERVRHSRLSEPARVATVAGLLAVSLATLVSAPLSGAPFYSLYQNALGERLARPGATFSEETYDYGVREAVAAIAGAAESGAVIVSDVPDVVAHYLARSNRPDLAVRSLSGEGIPNGARESWVVVQDEHIYFENQAVVEQLRQRLIPWREIRAGDAVALQVFRIEGR
ncbi:MAG: glycosyltransferase family 39 protein [Acidobacteria bacterium]|nr:glycosyltransferase family 39 protein [Acidobacteriota bacterium]